MAEIYYQPLLALAIGLIFIFLVRGRAERKRKILSNCKEVIGIVVDQEKGYTRPGTIGSPIYYPIVRFVTQDEVLIRQQYSEGRSPVKYATGQGIIIQYLVEDPKEFLIKGDDTTLINLALIMIGICLILYSAFLFFNIFFPENITHTILK